MYIEKVNSPQDIKGLNINELNVLADEIHSGVLNRVSNHGGHVGPNLGFTEATVAMHYVFDAPRDKFVFDVSHQVYPHKMLTGRKDGFLKVDDMNAISGYSSPRENSEYDLFEVGHTSTSVALASGLQAARDLLGEKYNIVVVLGDGSLSGGEAFEGLNVAAEAGTNFIVLFNDNGMSIAENHGGMYKSLAALRESNGESSNNIFRALGFDYMYVEAGNNISKLVDAFRKVKDIDHPIVVHLHTEKGHGYQPAVEDKEAWHWSVPFDLKTGKPKVTGSGESFTDLLGQYFVKKAELDDKLLVVQSAVPAMSGLSRERREALGKHYVDVGIAEEEAVALISGAAKAEAHPVWGTPATFMQRTYDQLCQDLAVNGNPAVINVLGASIYGMNDFTHICFFDIPMFSHIPNLVYLAPTTWEEFIAMEDWAIAQDKYSVALRVPCAVVHSDEEYPTDYSQLNKFQVTHRGSKVAVIAAGGFYQKGEAVLKLLADEGINATLINPRYLTGVDEQLLDELKRDHRLVVTLEDGSLDGGFGERIARYYGPTDMKVLNFGVKKALYDRYDVNDLLRDNHLTETQIVADIKTVLA